jgi:hypothetical protein
MGSNLSDVRERFGDDFLLMERYDRDLECQHRDVNDDGSLDPCHLEADYAINTPMENDVTRARYCSIHVWDALERYLAKDADGSDTDE